MLRLTNLTFVVALCMLVVTGCAEETDSTGYTSSPLVADAQAAAAEAPAPIAALPLPTDTPIPLPTEPPTPTPDPFLTMGAPIRLEIPAIGVDAFVEQVGLTPEKAMDVPKEWMNVAWYQLGSRPGEVGNAVIAGHVDTATGSPAVFWSLGQLVPGDEVVVTYESGDRLTFTVQDQQLYSHDANAQDIDTVFGPSHTADLNLITCDGVWDRSQRTYSQRRVVFTELAPEKTVRVNTTSTLD
jgi:sortase (surface protein transpeptidase)